jgi:hypothetical protein
MKINRNELYRLIIQENFKDLGLTEDKVDDLIAHVKGGPRPDWMGDDEREVPEPPEVPKPEEREDSSTYPMEMPPGTDMNDEDIVAAISQMIHGRDPEHVSELFQAVFAQIPGVEMGDAEEPPQTLYSPGAEGRPQAGFREDLMRIIEEELQEFMGRERPAYGEGNLTIDDVEELLPQLSPGEQADVLEKYMHLNSKDDLKSALRMNEEESNPWAICTSSVGREDKAKYEKCVKSVKKQNRGKK